MKDSDRETLIGLLKGLPVFRSLSEKNLRRIASHFTLARYGKGETVFFQTEESSDLYIVMSGAVKASLINDEGQELVLTCFREGDFFGEMSLLDGQPRSATMIAEQDSQLAILHRDAFLNILMQEPALAIDMLSALVRRLRKADEMIESLAFLDVKERVLRHLAETARAEGEPLKDGTIRIKKLTHRELAAHTGASREAITKVMKILLFNRVVRDEGKCLVLRLESGNE